MTAHFDSVMGAEADSGLLVVQPRMGFETVPAMTEGLIAVRDGVAGACLGTLTIDAYTRVNQPERAAAALARGDRLNGFPITVHGPEVTAEMLAAVARPGFAVQVRHGAAFPQHIFEAAAASGLDSIEGGPVSYNLPYSREPLAATVQAWSVAARFWADHAERIGRTSHIESFAGCMLGQLCRPSLLIALSVLEGRFFRDRGVPALSLSLAQGTHDAQDTGALIAMDRLAKHYLADVQTHMVFYTFMGLFPETPWGAEAIIRRSAEIARDGGAARLIVKTAREAVGIPSIKDNIAALNWASAAASPALTALSAEAMNWADVLEEEAGRLISAVEGLHDDVGQALIAAFEHGVLDVPHCIHRDNRNEARTGIDPETGAQIWLSTGQMPLSPVPANGMAHLDGAAGFHHALGHNRRRYDRAAYKRYDDSSG